MFDTPTRKLTLAGILVAIAVLGGVFSFPVLGSRCAPVQHLVNILAAVFLGPLWGVGVAFSASLLRNIAGLGSLMAFPGSMVGALVCGIVYHYTRRLGLTCIAEALGTGILGALAAYPVAALLMGLSPASYTVYIVPFLISTGAGSIAAYSPALPAVKTAAGIRNATSAHKNRAASHAPGRACSSPYFFMRFSCPVQFFQNIRAAR